MVDIEKLELLPKRESRWQYITRKYGDMWNLNKFDYPHWVKQSTNPWILSNRIIQNNIGKNFDLAFHYYCTKVEKQFQYIFLDKFKSYRLYDSDYLVNSSGNIIDNYTRYKRKDSKIIFKSWDYKEEATGVYKKNPITRKFEFSENKKLVSGWWREFESKKDPQYKVLSKQKKQKLKLKKKQYKKELDAYNDWILYKIEYDKKHKEDNINKIKIQAHGFDENSFRGLEYHGEKRKLK